MKLVKKMRTISDRQSLVGMAGSAAAILFMVMSTSAFGEYISGELPIELWDDFEDGPTNGYEIGDSPADGPWTVPSSAGGSATIVARPVGSGQAMAYESDLSSAQQVRYYTSTNSAIEFYMDFQWMPQPNQVSDRSGQTENRLLLQDSNGGKNVMRLEAQTIYPNPGSGAGAYNELVVVTGDGSGGTQEYNLGQISSTEFTQINLQLTPVDADNQQWSYNLWVDGEQKAADVAFTTISADAYKFDFLRFHSKYQENTFSYVDNFSLRTDHFSTPIPEPGSLGILGFLSFLLVLRDRR